MTGDTLHCNLQVPFRYSVFFTEHLFSPDNTTLGQAFSSATRPENEQCLVVIEQAVVDSNSTLPDAIQSAFQNQTLPELTGDPIVLAGSESAKNYKTVALVHELIASTGLSRHSFVIIIGGGAFLDVVGFAAATAHRGIRHLRIPTTTLSQADGGIGVKNGFNDYGKKNFVGTFAPPFAVINDFSFIRNLPAEIRKAGYIEAIKVALIRDAAFFHWIESNSHHLVACEDVALQYLIKRCAELHLAQIATGGDPFESGTARPLDFGHWAAHKLEQMSRYRISHATAVAIGIAIDLLYARRAGYLTREVTERVLSLLAILKLPLFAPELLLTDDFGRLTLLAGIEEFREHLGGQLSITLIRDIGSSFEAHRMEEELICEAVEELAGIAHAHQS